LEKLDRILLGTGLRGAQGFLQTSFGPPNPEVYGVSINRIIPGEVCNPPATPILLDNLNPGRGIQMPIGHSSAPPFRYIIPFRGAFRKYKYRKYYGILAVKNCQILG
jgi:hypothetical protein